MYMVNKKENFRYLNDNYITTKNELVLNLIGKAYCIGEFVDGSVNAYVVSGKKIESVWTVTESEREIYDKALYGIA